MGSCGVGIVSEGGVIGFGDEVGVIGFGDEGVGVVGVVVVTFFIVFGIPHLFDSVVLTNLSFGLLGSHIFDFSSGETVVLVGDGVTWAWLTLIIPISNTALAAAATTATIENAIPADLIIVFIFSIYHDLQYF